MVKDLNKKEPFVAKLVNNYGYIIWDKSILLQNNTTLSKNSTTALSLQSNLGTVVLLPIVKPDSSYVNVFLRLLLNKIL